MIVAMPDLSREGEEIIGRLRENEREGESKWESTAGSVRVEPPRSADSVTHDSSHDYSASFAFV